jgi:RNA polymerase sigma-70 factor (ECF subfamily)
MARARIRRKGAPDLRSLADEELMDLIGKGSDGAFEVVYDRHSTAAFSLAYRMTGRDGLAQDVTQEAFLSLWRAHMRFDASRGSLRTWLLGIVHNRAIDMLRKSSAHRDRRAGAEGLEERLVAPDNTEHEVVRRSEADDLHTVLHELPDDQRNVLELAYFGGFSQTEIATMLDTPLGTVKGRMRLGLTKLRTELPAPEEVPG